MSSPLAHQDYWARLRSGSAMATVLRLAPPYGKHFLARPFRRGLLIPQPPTLTLRLRGRHSAAALDMWLDGFLAALGEVLAVRFDRRAGSLAVRYVRLLSAINKEFEHRLATGKPLKLTSILAEPLVRSCEEDWVKHARDQGYSERVVAFMTLPDFVQDYDAYLAVTTRKGFTSNPSAQIESILLDSGGYVERLTRLVAESKGCAPADAVLRDCFNLGIAAKYADELADVCSDRAEGRYNLLLALLTSRPHEEQAFERALLKKESLTARWWSSSAPDTFGEFTQGFLDHYGQINSPAFRHLCDVTMLRSANGLSRRPTTRAPRAVSEAPTDPWR